MPNLITGYDGKKVSKLRLIQSIRWTTIIMETALSRIDILRNPAVDQFSIFILNEHNEMAESKLVIMHEINLAKEGNYLIRDAAENFLSA